MSQPENRTAARVGTRNGGKEGQSTVSGYHNVDRVKRVKPLDRTLAATEFSTIQASRKRDVNLSLRQLKKKIEDTVADSKQELPWIKLGRFGNERTDKGSYRSNANMLSFDGIEGDYDREQMPIAEAAARLRKAGIAALLYESASSTPEKPRWRAMCPCSWSLPPERREAIVARLNGVLGGVLDGASFTMSQAFYYGGVTGKPAPLTALVEGDYIDLRPDLDAGAMWKAGGRESHKAEVGEDMRGLRSDIAWEIAMDLHHEGETKQTFLSRIDQDPILKAWAKEKGERQVDRAWDRSKVEFDMWEAHIKALLPPVPDEPSDIDALNRKYAVVRIGGKTVIAHFKPNGSIDFGNVSDLHAIHANDRVVLPNSRGKRVPASEAWMQSPKRLYYPNGVDFDPSRKLGSKTLNLWTGWGVEPDPRGSCKRLLNHLRNVICSGHVESYDYLVGWMAHLVQHPEEKPGVAPVFKGEKGTGKTVVSDYLAKMIGERHAPKIAQASHLTGRFNAHMEAALLLRVEEAIWAGDRSAESPLKNLVTSETLAIERKGIDVGMVRSVMRLIITSNAEQVVPASADERRWAVFNVSNSRVGDRAYFDAYAAEMEGDGPGALLHYLQHYDLTGFDVRTPPKTEGLLQQKLASLRDFERFWFNALYRGALPGRTEWKTQIGAPGLAEDYNTNAKDDRFHAQHLDERAIGKKLRKLCPAVERERVGPRSDRKRYYVLPTLDECRSAFEKWLGASIDWSDSDA